MTHIVFLDQPPFWSVLDLVIRIGLVVVTRLVLDFPVARYGRIALACRGIVPATVATVVAVVRIVSTFFSVVTRLVRRFCVVWIARAILVGVLAIFSLQMTGFKILVFLLRGRLAATARILLGMTITIVPSTISRQRRNSFFVVIASASASIVCVLSSLATLGVATHFVVEPMFQFASHLVSGGLSDLIIPLLL